MVRSLIFIFILLNLPHCSNGLQRSDWSYDRETNTAFFTINGITYSCPPWDIIGPVAIRHYQSMSDPCLDGVKSLDDPSCVPVQQVIRDMSELVMKRQSPACNVLAPTAEETLGRIEKVHRSTSLARDNPATPHWYGRLLHNLTRLENDCGKNWSNSLQTERVKNIKQLAPTAVELGRNYLPQLIDKVYHSQMALEEALERGVVAKNLSATFANERLEREQILSLELAALQDTYDHEMTTWYELAKHRTYFVRNMSLSMSIENFSIADGTRKVVEIRMDMLTNMAEANELLAQMEYIVRDVDINLELVCLSRDDPANTDLPFGFRRHRHQKNGSPLTLAGFFSFLIILFRTLVEWLM